VAALSWTELVERSGVSRADIDRAVALLRAARRGIFLWAMGLTHHAHGVDNVLALANVALARGWVGRPARGCCRSAAIRTCRASAPAASRRR